MITRRGLFGVLAGAIAAPIVVRSGLLMPVKAVAFSIDQKYLMQVWDKLINPPLVAFQSSVDGSNWIDVAPGQLCEVRSLDLACFGTSYLRVSARA